MIRKFESEIMKKIFGFLAGLFVLVANSVATAQPMRMDNSLLWRISGGGLTKPSYLFGTIHMICPEDYLWTAAMKKAFEQSDKVCLEMDLDDESVMAAATMGLMDKTGKKLSDYFTKEDYKLLTKYVKDSLGMSILLFESMKPIALQTLFATKIDYCESPVSYEEKMTADAKKNGKEVIGLETAEEQLVALESIPVDSVIKDIMDMVQNKTDDKGDEVFGEMVAAYKAQDIQKLQKMIMEGDGLGGATATLLDGRNKKWISRMSAMMKKSNVFFAVGAGHLYGEYGVISLLRQQGYMVDPILEMTR